MGPSLPYPATVYKSTIRNYSSTPSRRANFTVGIGYDLSTAKAQLVIAEVLRSHPAVLPTPEPLVLVNDLGAATVNLKILYWFDSKTFAPDKINSACSAWRRMHCSRMTSNCLTQLAK